VEMLMHANEIIINVFETEISTKSNSNVLKMWFKKKWIRKINTDDRKI
jgi:hypothetical protein